MNWVILDYVLYSLRNGRRVCVNQFHWIDCVNKWNLKGTRWNIKNGPTLTTESRKCFVICMICALTDAIYSKIHAAWLLHFFFYSTYHHKGECYVYLCSPQILFRFVSSDCCILFFSLFVFWCTALLPALFRTWHM